MLLLRMFLTSIPLAALAHPSDPDSQIYRPLDPLWGDDLYPGWDIRDESPSVVSDKLRVAPSGSGDPGLGHNHDQSVAKNHEVRPVLELPKRVYISIYIG